MSNSILSSMAATMTEMTSIMFCSDMSPRFIAFRAYFPTSFIKSALVMMPSILSFFRTKTAKW